MANQELVTLAKKGDLNAFVSLIDERKQSLYHVALAILKSESLAQDCIQSTMLKAFQSIRTLRQVEYFDTWLTRICINECNKEYNASKKRVSLDDVPELSVDGKYDHAYDFVEALPYELNQIVSLKVFQENTYRDIAEILEQPESTIKSKYYKALTLLRVEMEDSYD